MKRQQKLKLLTALLISTLFIYSFSHIGAITYNAMTTDNKIFLTGTYIASVDASGKSASEALTLLPIEVEKWQQETVIQLKYKEKQVPINLEVYQFDLPSSVGSAESGAKNSLTTFIDSMTLKKQVAAFSPGINLSEEQMNNLMNELLPFGQNLMTGNHEVSIDKVLADGNSEELLNETTLELENVSVAMTDWLNELSPISVPANSQVSFLKLIEDHKLSTISTEVMSMIASGLYQTILPTNFEITERHIGQKYPGYVGLGFEAKISPVNKLDFSFANPNEVDYKINLKWDYQTLTVQLIGSPFLYSYEIEQLDKKEFKPKTIIQFSPQLQASQTRIKEAGKTGLYIKVVRKVYAENGSFLREELLSEDYYAPVERVEVHGFKVNIANNENEQSPSTKEVNSEGEITNSETVDSETEVQSDMETAPSATDSTQRKASEIWGKPNETDK